VGHVSVSLIPLEDVALNTRFGAFANKFILENSERRCKSHGMSLMPNEILQLKQEWHKLYKHCLDQIDARFPPTSMLMFQLLQVIDPSKICSPIATRINNIAGEDVTHAVAKLLLIFELPLIAAGRLGTHQRKLPTPSQHFGQCRQARSYGRLIRSMHRR
jgi:hypothetical protein